MIHLASKLIRIDSNPLAPLSAAPGRHAHVLAPILALLTAAALLLLPGRAAAQLALGASAVAAAGSIAPPPAVAQASFGPMPQPSDRSSATSPSFSVLPIRAPRSYPLSTRFKLHALNALGPAALLSSATAAAWGQLWDTPPEWREGMHGYSRRFADSVGESMAQQSIGFVAGAALAQDGRYDRMPSLPLRLRVEHSILREFYSYRYDGRPTPATARLLATFGGALLTLGWQPPSNKHFSYGMERAGISVASSVGTNLLLEFLPDVQQRLGHPRPRVTPSSKTQ
jgi:hypothetical protein